MAVVVIIDVPSDQLETALVCTTCFNYRSSIKNSIGIYVYTLICTIEDIRGYVQTHLYLRVLYTYTLYMYTKKRLLRVVTYNYMKRKLCIDSAVRKAVTEIYHPEPFLKQYYQTTFFPKLTMQIHRISTEL